MTRSERGGGSGQRGGNDNNRSSGGGGRGGNRGGHRSGRITGSQKSQIVGSKRKETLQISSEGTDDVIIAAPADEDLQHFASFVLQKKEFVAFNGQRQIRKFVNSCLLNLSNHHNIDTTGILTDLASAQGRRRTMDILEMRMGVDAADDKNILSFQYVILPFIGVLTRESVCQSTMTSESGIIYSTVYMNRGLFLEKGVLPCMGQLIERRSVKDTSMAAQRLLQQEPSICQPSSLQAALLAITRLVYQLIKRTQDARIEMAGVVQTLYEQQMRCVQVSDDSAENRFINEVLEREVTRLRHIIADAQDTIIHPISPLGPMSENRSRRGPNKVHIKLAYDPPGELSKDGPRHDNDDPEISRIKLLPTQEEIVCSRTPFLPSNGIHDAPHFLPHGWRRQLDTHFRLYREDMLDPLRKGIMGFLNALERTGKGNEDILLKQKELRKYIDDNVNLTVYGNVQFMGMNCTKQLSGSVDIAFAQPPSLVGASHKKRTEFWDRAKKRVMQGALVCITSRADDDTAARNTGSKSFQMILGVVTKRDPEILAKDPNFAHIHISLTDPKNYLVMLNSTTQSNSTQWFLVESTGGFYGSYSPILKALQKCVPASLPFGKYIAPSITDLNNVQANEKPTIDPPLYARAPRFTFDLSVLLKGLPCRLNVSDPYSVRIVEADLQSYSTLDKTQATALVETLCREVALISGPPGTGKTKIGVDLMRVLLHNKAAMNCGPILCICYTNHALDQFLEHLLDEGITSIVRVGARSKSDRLEDYNLERLMQSRDKPFSVRQSLRAANEKWDVVSAQITKLERALRDENLHWEYVGAYLLINNYDHWEQISERQPVIGSEFAIEIKDQPEKVDDEGFKTVGGGKDRDQGPYYRWITGKDIDEKIQYNERLEAPNIANVNSFGVLDEDLGIFNKPRALRIPSYDRPLRQLHGNVWDMSKSERKRLQESWKPEVQKFMMDKMAQLLEEVEKINQTKNNAFDDIRRGILKDTSVIGMTTNGAAKLQTLVGAVAPKIIICEEAGEVLESHILAALSTSTQHLILIGDHLQLRPSIESYNLSSDSPIGQNYNLDKSLFERLVTDTVSPFPLSKLTIQRRMRPEISSLIRNTLYPNLEDGEAVFRYPPVGGMAKNLFFMDHLHPEDSKDQYGMQSFANTFEIKMVEALAQYLIKTGYDQPGDIAVLTPYLGQLSKLRDHLRSSFMLTIDERDQEQLDEKDAEDENNNVNESVGVKRIGLQKHLTLRTIDNYQGEEAKIVIITLVRSNAKENGALAASSSIGFLKSRNRTNVLLSRAKHGMYIIGNASLMENAKNELWPKIIQELRQHDRVGDGFPIVCKNHPHIKNIVSVPKDFKIVSPNGGCTAACGRSMPCGHTCPQHCHPDDVDHILVKCFEPCPRLHDFCEHVCPKLCGEKCGNCMEIVAPMVLPCGHIFDKPQCWQSRNPSKVTCQVKVIRKLPTCEHEQVVHCNVDIKTMSCKKPCRCALPCGHSCERPCSECQNASVPKKGAPAVTGLIERKNHGKCKTECGRQQFCGHPCTTACHGKDPCPPCKKKCEVVCAHSKCHHKCNEACAACCQRCTWECPHQGRCEMPCGAPCDRLPCDLRCEKMLNCGHQCPSVCGEKCPSKKFCVECKDPATMSMLVDVIMRQTLEEIDIEEDLILELSCGHALTVASLDGMMEMNQYYENEMDKKTGIVTFTGKKDLPSGEVPQVACHLCRKPITSLHRYGRRIKVAQLSQRCKKFQITQAKFISDAKRAFDVARVRVEENETKFLESLLRHLPEPCEVPPEASTRLLGKTDGTRYFPNTTVDDLTKVYNIPKEHEEAWKKHIHPVLSSLTAFRNINKKVSPTKQLFDAAVSHLYRIKVAPSYDANQGQVTQPLYPEHATTVSDVVQACILECGLPRDGHSGSSFVDSIQERANVLIFLITKVGSVISRLDKNNAKSGTNSGWYWFMEDLLLCARVHVEKLQTTAREGKRDRTAAYASVMRMDLIIKTVQLIASKPLPQRPDDENMKQRRKAADEWTEQFMIEHKAIKDHCPLGIKEELTEKADILEERMTAAVRAARGDTEYLPVTEEEKLMLIRAVEQTLSGTGRWYRCPNGHPYVIGECGMAMESSECPECGARVGGGDHRLLQTNAVNTEFENLRQNNGTTGGIVAGIQRRLFGIF
ncbi:hypothetical protein BGZ79_004031 [Entomortierella chlamydospora]|nr:hypothetical protein BGZ79_004031 [Entomortierella chlamydospora]